MHLYGVAILKLPDLTYSSCHGCTYRNILNANVVQNGRYFCASFSRSIFGACLVTWLQPFVKLVWRGWEQKLFSWFNKIKLQYLPIALLLSALDLKPHWQALSKAKRLLLYLVAAAQQIRHAFYLLLLCNILVSLASNDI